MTAPADTSRLRKALASLAALVAGLALVVVLSRCSTPSTIHTGDAAGADTDSINATGAGIGAIAHWASEPAALVRVQWLDPDTALVTARLPDGEHVAVTAVRANGDWAVPAPPSPAPTPTPPDWADLPHEYLVLAGSDPRWHVTRGFLDAWLAREPTERWTAVDFEAPPLSVNYDSWEFTGLGAPSVVPGTSIEVVPVDIEATSAGSTRNYRVFVAVVADATGRWTVNAVAHRQPRQQPEPPPDAQAPAATQQDTGR